MKSKLFVPASRPELFAKALAGEAEAISLDLEDAVAESRKAQARAAVTAFLQSDAALRTRKTLIVRVNAIDTPHFAHDMAAVVRPGLRLINLPKIESAAQVRAAAAVLAQAERAHGLRHPIGLLLNIETPRALRMAADLALSEPRVRGLQLGLGDLFEPLGIERRGAAAVAQALFAVRLAAGEAGIAAYDAAFADIHDIDGFRAEAELSRRLGFQGKSCIHPSQVAVANAVYRPSDCEIAQARKVLDAARVADAQGTGAYLVDAQMVDKPFVARAQAIVDSARALDLPP
ncbi:HpcH/HpaI aldolase/citrate lyase family protein [Verminephrobacter eiseniae]|uniref:Citryl-CoA lyase n=1 Tax=Verminephrobacter eiseniae (strain EF01-2) TaxID=391735 RepID=A1WMC4_VEREI|nr:CoA ester lyase [Verminephrobacter eiseniae]ABM58781.1 Citryl-CoA lyase [Verminephrobacter eiseniae EF01-2]MCW5284350.1 CoA ester lyase [Verminephrobacter eiseniae]MCW5302056.1 CoA ester lyase [Verminephrobacter eiseniae]MCW8179570.1 CoA ester lyase [Verminephrobacter eiseniae]MCW8191017.1 CoA ester lyase [Verminephrobacter eiseniae]